MALMPAPMRCQKAFATGPEMGLSGCGRVAQLAEHSTLNRQVEGSIPSASTIQLTLGQLHSRRRKALKPTLTLLTWPLFEREDGKTHPSRLPEQLIQLTIGSDYGARMRSNSSIHPAIVPGDILPSRRSRKHSSLQLWGALKRGNAHTHGKSD